MNCTNRGKFREKRVLGKETDSPQSIFADRARGSRKSGFKIGTLRLGVEILKREYKGSSVKGTRGS